eukprot:354366_1
MIFVQLVLFIFLQVNLSQQQESVPYSSNSPWNTMITNPIISPHSDHYISILENSRPFISAIAAFDKTLYFITSNTSIATVHLEHYFIATNNNKDVNRTNDITISIPIPSNAVGSPGSDSEMILWDKTSSNEIGFWQFEEKLDKKNSYKAVAGYNYNTTWNAVPPQGFNCRGSGIPYLAGLIRKWEIEQGHIDHALAFSLTNTSSEWVYPAIRSDGTHPNGIPEGTRFQIDPKYTQQDMKNWGLNQTGIIIAQCLQKYGMYVVDTTGANNNKIGVEDTITAGWDGLLYDDTVSPIPKNVFSAIEPPQH